MTASAPSSSVDRLLADLLERATREIKAGKPLDLDALIAEYPDQADQLRQLLPAVQLLADLSNSVGSGSSDSSFILHPSSFSSEPLGDFQILREVGRGGMGIVYEAVQLSLNRKVALKVLPFAATMDPRHLQRFRNEAQAAACLHHPNIVPVHGVGCDRGVHYYAMQLIEGQTLAEVIAASRERERPESCHSERSEESAGSLEDASRSLAALGMTNRDTAPAALLSTKRDRAHFRHIATLIASAADALEYAHSMGVVHRDIKPGNIMLDFSPLPASGRGAGGEGAHLWITDFGLAKLANPADLASPDRKVGDNLTLTGDLIGTLRYMSPEQALAKHGLVDHRTDIYSLGATLYELLTLKPAVAGNDKAEILKAIAWDEPTPLRKHDRSIPAELETITLKCLAKEPAERYATAGEVAEDLRRWLSDRAIKAKPPGWREKAAKWGRRHPGISVTTGLIAGLLIAGGWAWHREVTNAERAAIAVAEESDQLLNADRLPEALQAARRAADLLPRFGGDTGLRQLVTEHVADLQLLDRLERARLEQTASRVDLNRFDVERAAPLFRRAFQDFGVDVIDGDADAVVDALKRRKIGGQLSAALFEWHRISTDRAERGRLAQVAEALDADPRQLVSRVRQAEAANDVKSLKRLAEETQADLPPPMVLVRIGYGLQGVSAFVEAEKLLRAGQHRYPADFWINYELAFTLNKIGKAHAAEAVRFLSAALALRPQSGGAWNALGAVLSTAGQRSQALAALQKAVALDPDDAGAHVNLGRELKDQRRPAEAEAVLRKAITLRPNSALAQMELGIALKNLRRFAEAEECYRRALALRPDYALAHGNLGVLLAESNRLPEAETHYRRAIEIKPDFADAHNNLGNWFRASGRHSEAEPHYRRAISIDPDNAFAQNNLGALLRDSNRLAEAEAFIRRAIYLKPDFVEAHLNLAGLMFLTMRPADAENSYRRAIAVRPSMAAAHDGLGLALIALNKPAESVAAHRRAIELNPANADFQYNLAHSLTAAGQPQEAEAAYRKSISLNPGSGDAYFNLSVLLMKQGRFREALDQRRIAHEMGSKLPGWPYPSAQWVREAELFVSLDQKLLGVLSGAEKPVSATENLILARICQEHKKLYAAASRFYADAFAAEPRLTAKLNSHRYNAACAAVLASCGEGSDAKKMNNVERSQIRQLALNWLIAELAACSKLGDKPAERQRLGQIMQHWQKDPELGGVRDVEALARLPESERAQWQKLWADAAELLKRVETPKAKETQPPPKP